LETLVAVFQDAVRVVEQERGLELQVNSPESTLTTMLPIVNVIEAARVLKIEDLSARLEATDNEPVNDLNRETCSTRPEATDNEPVRDLKIESRGERLEAIVSEAVGV